MDIRDEIADALLRAVMREDAEPPEAWAQEDTRPLVVKAEGRWEPLEGVAAGEPEWVGRKHSGRVRSRRPAA